MMLSLLGMAAIADRIRRSGPAAGSRISVGHRRLHPAHGSRAGSRTTICAAVGCPSPGIAFGPGLVWDCAQRAIAPLSKFCYCLKIAA
jgi:hypothetical protein